MMVPIMNPIRALGSGVRDIARRFHVELVILRQTAGHPVAVYVRPTGAYLPCHKLALLDASHWDSLLWYRWNLAHVQYIHLHKK